MLISEEMVGALFIRPGWRVFDADGVEWSGIVITNQATGASWRLCDESGIGFTCWTHTLKAPVRVMTH